MLGSTDSPEATGTQEHPGAESFFRQRAVDDYVRRDLEGALLAAAPRWLAAVSAGMLTLVTASLVVLSLARVEVTSLGPCVVVPRGGGARPIISQIGGPVSELVAKTGDVMGPGDPLLRIDSLPIKAQLLEAERNRELARAALARVDGEVRQRVDNRIKLGEEHARLLAQKSASLTASVGRLQAQVDAYKSLVATRDGARSELDAAAERLAQALREKIGVEEQLNAIRDQNTLLRLDFSGELARGKLQLETAEARVASLNVSLEQTTVRAPAAGYVEALLVHSGEVLQSGSTVARLVPNGPPTTVVAFIPERDRAFLELGADARLELAQLPPGEFPQLHARVVSISQDPASSREIRDALGDEAKISEPTYRIELDLLIDPTAARLGLPFRTGMLGTVRVVLRKRRLIGIIFAPLRAWLNP